MPGGLDASGSYSKPSTTDFEIPWCESYANNPNWRPKVAGSLIVSANTENSLVGETLRTPDGVRDIKIFMKVRPAGVTAKQVSEAAQFVSLGAGVNGVPHTCHGGLIALLIDEATGEVAVDVFGAGFMTAELACTYKRALVTPKIVLCRAWLAKDVTGRSARIEGTVEGEDGTVYATGSVVYVKLKEKL